jgi:hypothetical protein
VLPDNEALPSYTAVIESVPARRVVVVTVATPSVSEAVPRAALPLLNVTLPVAFLDDDKTVAVNVTGRPRVEGFNEVSSIVVVVPIVATIANLDGAPLEMPTGRKLKLL